MFTLPERIRASRKALWAECTDCSSSSRSTVWALERGFVLSIGSLLYISSLRTWSTIFKSVYGSLRLGFMIWDPAASVAEWRPPSPPNYEPRLWLPGPVIGRAGCPLRPEGPPKALGGSVFPRFYSSLEHSLKKTFRRTSSFFLWLSSNLTLLNCG